MKTDYTFCKGEGCKKKESCYRYTQGKKLPDGSWWWIQRCNNNQLYQSGL